MQAHHMSVDKRDSVECRLSLTNIRGMSAWHGGVLVHLVSSEIDRDSRDTGHGGLCWTATTYLLYTPASSALNYIMFFVPTGHSSVLQSSVSSLCSCPSVFFLLTTARLRLILIIRYNVPIIF